MTVVISHRFSTVRLADVIVVVEGGASGSTGATTSAPDGLYAELDTLQARAYR